MKAILAVVLSCAAAAAAAGSGYSLKEARCLERLADHLVIASARLDGRPIEELKAGSRHPEPRRSQVMALIDEAYAAEDARAWFQERYWYPCVRADAQAPHRGFIPTASSQPLPDPSPAQRERCQVKLRDYAIVGRSVTMKIPREVVEYHAQHGDALHEARRARILRLIDEAYGADNVQAWYDAYEAKCLRADPEFAEAPQ
jgi:hypothetical protein